MSRLGFQPENAGIEHLLKRSVSYNGIDIYWDGDTDEHTGVWKDFVVLEDAIVAAITDDGTTASVGIDGGTLPAGTYVPANGNFTSIQLTSGTVSMGRA